MKYASHVLLVVGSVSLLSLSGCETAGQTAVLGGAVDTFGDFAHLSPEQRGMVHLAAQIIYTISDNQRREAEERAREALANAEFRRAVARRHARYVAVPVRANGDQPKARKVVVLYDTQTNQAVDKGYVPAQKHYAKGEEANFGGKEAVVATSFSGV